MSIQTHTYWPLTDSFAQMAHLRDTSGQIDNPFYFVFIVWSVFVCVCVSASANFRSKREHLWPFRLILNQFNSRGRAKFSKASLVCQQRNIRPLDAQLCGFMRRSSLILCCETDRCWKWLEELYTSMGHKSEIP